MKIKKVQSPRSPLTLLILLVVSIIIIEILMMLFLTMLLPITSVANTLLDTISLASLLFIVLYFFMFRPMMQNNAQRIKAEHEILAGNRKYEVLLHMARDGICVLDTDGKVVQVNDAFSRMLGYNPDEMRGMNATRWNEQWSSYNLKEKIHNPIGSSVTFESKLLCRGGNIIDVEINAVGVEFEVEQIFLCAVQDITACKVAEARQQLAASIFTHAREGIAITDTSGAIVDINNTFTRITGYSREEAIGQNPRILNSGRQTDEYYAGMWRALNEEGYWYGEIWNRRKDGEVYAEMLTIRAVRDADGKNKNYVALFTDVTPMKEHQKQLEYIAHYDTLTSLPNRVLLADRMQQAMLQSQRRGLSLAVAYLDLDEFKAVNEFHGHGVGDELLITIAQRMKDALRDGDTLARIGGDEFVAVLVDLERPQDCEPVLARLLQAAADPVMVGAEVLHVSTSIGVTLYPQDGADADQLMRHADQAMYQAKLAGKNRYHQFDVDQDAAVKIQIESIEHIRCALKRGEFVLYYQPKVNMKTGKVIGAEALIRWLHPERGLLLPSAFLPVIENDPISVDVGKWVIAKALEQMAEWHLEGLEIPVSVNISGYELQQPDFVTHLSEQLAKHPTVPPHWLELEVLETSALEDIVQVSRIMHACRAIGVHFSLDDFGTGYCSLIYLKRLPTKSLKIDQRFVRNMLEDSDDLSIVEGVMGLARAFRMEVIAEGVESTVHGELLLSLGCNLAQGYGIARPMPAAELPFWVINWHPDESWMAWRGRIPNRDDRTVVFAEVKHRHWIHDIESYLTGDKITPPQMDAYQCQFGHWQETEGRALFGEHPVFQNVVDMHNRIHALGRRLLGLYDHGEHAQIHEILTQLHISRDELIAELRLLVRAV